MKKILRFYQIIMGIVLLSLTGMQSIYAQSWSETDKILPFPNNQEEEYGYSVEIDGNYAVVGARGYYDDKGCAYVLYFNGTDWETQARLTTSDSDWCARSVSISGDVIAVSAINEGVYVFVKPVGGWEDMTQTAKLTPSDITGDEFGWPVRISGDNIVTGAIYADDIGAAYVFTKPGGGWSDMTQTAKLTSSDGALSDDFGWSVSISNDVIVVGAHWHDEPGASNNGAGYVYVKPEGGWTDMTEDGKLTPTDMWADNHLGYSVDIDNDVIILGALYGRHPLSSYERSIYVYTKPVSGWKDTTETAELYSINDDYIGGGLMSLSISNDVIICGKNIFEKPEEGWKDTCQIAILSPKEYASAFGEAVSISNNTILIGAYSDDNGDPNTGSAFFFEKPAEGWVDTTQDYKTLPLPMNDYNNYGQSLACDGDYAVVGEPGYRDYQGCAFVLYYNGSEWQTKARLTASDGEAEDHFGNSVSISGDEIVIGAYGDDSNKGSAYVFEKGSAWSDMTETAKLTSSDGATGDAFGFYSICISGDIIAVGAYADGDGDYIGSAYVFEKPGVNWTTMTETGKLTASDAAVDDWFGQVVSVSGELIVVAAHNDDDGGLSSGSVYIFEKPGGGWGNMTQTGKLTASDAAEYDRFGESVYVYNNVVAVGAIWDDDYGAKSGSVYVFEEPVTGWKDTTQLAKLTASDGVAGDWLGSSVVITNDMIVSGAYAVDSYTGAAYVFNKPEGGWEDMTHSDKLAPTDGEANDYFGISVGITGDQILAGAYWESDRGIKSGAVYVNQLFGDAMFSTFPGNKINTCTGGEVYFYMVGENITNYQWQVSTDDGDTFSNLIEGDPYSYTQSATLMVIPNSSLDSNLFRCIGSNPVSADTSGAGILIIDNTPPVITSTHDEQYVGLNDNCEAFLPNYIKDIAVTDNCDASLNLNYAQSPVPGTAISGTTNNVIYTVTDDEGNSSQVSFNVVVVDNTNPVITSTHNDQSVDADASCEATIPDYTGDVESTDNCDDALDITQSQVAGSTISGATNAITLTATDDAGNTDEVTYNVEVVDNTNPVITCPGDLTVTAASDGDYTISGTDLDATATDNCEVSSVINNSNSGSSLDGVTFAIGTYTVEWTATDNSDNVANCSFNITVEEEDATGLYDLKDLGIKIYPNPAKNNINIEFNNTDIIQEIRLFDLLGKQLYISRGKIQNQLQIDLSSFNESIYLLYIRTDKSIYTKKIIKE